MRSGLDIPAGLPAKRVRYPVNEFGHSVARNVLKVTT